MLESFFRWCESTLIGRAVAESVWAFPILEAVHLLGLCMLGGALLVVDLRLLGAGLTGQPVARLARHARRWLITALVIMVATGIPLFLSEAIKAYYNTSFWVKMITLPVALCSPSRCASGWLAGRAWSPASAARLSARCRSRCGLPLRLRGGGSGFRSL